MLRSYLVFKYNKLKKYRIDSLCVSENREIKNGDSHVLPINASSAFSFENIEESIDIFTGEKKGFVYGRYANPSIESVEKKLAALESLTTEHDAYCVLTSSGMSAISTLLLSQLQAGDSILTQHELYGGTTELMNAVISKYDINLIRADLNDKDEINRILSENESVKLIYLESPTNPTLSCVDIAQIAELKDSHSVKIAIDNTFSTAYLQQATEGTENQASAVHQGDQDKDQLTGVEVTEQTQCQ